MFSQFYFHVHLCLEVILERKILGFFGMHEDKVPISQYGGSLDVFFDFQCVPSGFFFDGFSNFGQKIIFFLEKEADEEGPVDADDHNEPHNQIPGPDDALNVPKNRRKPRNQQPNDKEFHGSQDVSNQKPPKKPSKSTSLTKY